MYALPPGGAVSVAVGAAVLTAAPTSSHVWVLGFHRSRRPLLLRSSGGLAAAVCPSLNLRAWSSSVICSSTRACVGVVGFPSAPTGSPLSLSTTVTIRPSANLMSRTLTRVYPAGLAAVSGLDADQSGASQTHRSCGVPGRMLFGSTSHLLCYDGVLMRRAITAFLFGVIVGGVGVGAIVL